MDSLEYRKLSESADELDRLAQVEAAYNSFPGEEKIAAEIYKRDDKIERLTTLLQRIRAQVEAWNAAVESIINRQPLTGIDLSDIPRCPNCERLRLMSTVEMMIENQNVRHHVEEWEKRCLKAEAEVERLRAELNERDTLPPKERVWCRGCDLPGENERLTALAESRNIDIGGRDYEIERLTSESARLVHIEAERDAAVHCYGGSVAEVERLASLVRQYELVCIPNERDAEVERLQSESASLTDVINTALRENYGSTQQLESASDDKRQAIWALVDGARHGARFESRAEVERLKEEADGREIAVSHYTDQCERLTRERDWLRRAMERLRDAEDTPRIIKAIATDALAAWKEGK
jgi:hypothetical protein